MRLCSVLGYNLGKNTCEYTKFLMDPLLDRDKIKELRKIRNKEKRERKKLEKLHERNKKFESNQISIVSKEILEKDKSLLTSPGRVNTYKKVEPPRLSNYMIVTTKIKNVPKKVKIEDEVKHFRGKQREVVKEKPKSRLKKDLNTVMELNECSSHEHQIFDYSDNPLNETINVLCTSFIKRVVDLQESFYKRDPNKAKLKKRYVTGFHELKKYMGINFIKMIIITRDIKVLHENDPLHESIIEIINMAKVNCIPYIFALNRRDLGKLTLKFRPISCFGVLDYDGANIEFTSLIEEIIKIKPEFSSKEFHVHEDISDLFIKLHSTLK